MPERSLYGFPWKVLECSWADHDDWRLAVSSGEAVGIRVASMFKEPVECLRTFWAMVGSDRGFLTSVKSSLAGFKAVP